SDGCGSTLAFLYLAKAGRKKLCAREGSAPKKRKTNGRRENRQESRSLPIIVLHFMITINHYFKNGLTKEDVGNDVTISQRLWRTGSLPIHIFCWAHPPIEQTSSARLW